jgi:uncharacterized membrane protein YeaQ/YmgE (transglycosylase-associated protein family)
MNGLIWWIIVGLVAGWLAGQIMKGSGFGAMWDIILGLAGAVIGGWIFGALGIATGGGMLYSIVVALIGACLLIAISRLFSGRRPV